MSSRPLPKKRGWGRRVLAAAVATVLAVGLLPFAPQAAVAAPGDSGVESLTVSTVYDGARFPNVCDAGAADGTVATNDSVGFAWGGGFPEQGQTYVMSQTLPVGWTWDASVISQTTSDGTNGLYQSTATITDSGRTLTVELTPLQAGLDIELRTLRAIPSTAAGNTSYTPVLRSSSVEGEEDASAAAISVCAEPISTLSKRAFGGQRTVVRGGVSGIEVSYQVVATVPANAVGQQEGTSLAAPATITDTWDGPTSSVFELAASPGNVGVNAAWTAGTNEVVFTLDDDLAFGATKDIRYTVWWPESDLPQPTSPALQVTNTAHADWSVPPQTNDVQAVVNLNAGGAPIRGALSKQLFWATASGAATFPADPATDSDWSALAANASQTVPSGSLVVARMTHTGVSIGGTYTAYTQRDVSDEWNPAEQRLSTGDLWVGTDAGVPLAPSEYTVQYRSGGVWHASVAAAGGLAAIDGLQVSPVGGTPAGQQYLIVAAAFEVVAPDGTRPVTDNALATLATESAPTPATVGRAASYAVGSVVLGITKTASLTSIASGSDVDFTIVPTVEPPMGATSAATDGLTVTNTLPSNVVSYEIVGLDPFWMRQPDTTDAAGNTVLTFTHAGTVRSSDTIPSIVVSTETSVQAPSGGVMTNVVTVSATEGAPATARASVAVFQANVIALTKSVDMPLIQIGDDTVSWTARWFNFQASSQGVSYVVDVLPYAGDPRNTDFSGTFELSSLVLSATATAGVAVEYTTDAPATVASTPAENPGGVVNWQPVVDLSAPPADATAVRVVINDFVTGTDGVGSLQFVGSVDGQQAGDSYVNTAFGFIGSAQRSLAETPPAAVDVVSSWVSGRVVVDQDRTGVYDAAMPGLPGVTVGLFDAAAPASPVATVVTGADGAYEFETRAGDYVVRLVDVPAYYEPVFSPAGAPGGRASDAFSLGLDGEIGDVNFGEALPTSTFGVTKTVQGPFALDADEFDDVTFTVSYTADNGASGELELSEASNWQAELADALPAGTIVTLTEQAVDAADLPVYAAWDSYRWVAGDGYTVSADGLTATLEILPDVVPELMLQNTFSELLGDFTLTKVVTGDAAERVPGDAVFVAEYSLDDGVTWTALPDMTLDAPTVAGLGDLRVGTVVLLRELDPPVIEGVEWFEESFSGVSVTQSVPEMAAVEITSTGTVEVTLTNPTSERNGQFALTKTITGAGDSMLSEEGIFTVDYVYPGQAEVESFIVRNGESFTSPLLPEGTEVTITEQTPTGGLVEGASWGDPTIVLSDGAVLDNGATVVIEADAVVAVTLENPTVAPLPVPESPETAVAVPVTPVAPGLAITGGTISVAVALLAALSVLSGVLLLVVARRRRRA